MLHSTKFSSQRFRAMAIFCLGFSLYLLLLYPGFMSADSVMQILEGRDGAFSDWHPPTMAVVWGKVDHVIAGPFGMLLIQTSLIWLGMYFVYDAYFAESSSLRFAWALFALMFFPLIISIAGVIWKDVWMWAMLVLTFGLLGQLGKGTMNMTWNMHCLLAAVFCVLVALLFRHNAIFAAMPLILFGTQINRPAKTLMTFALKVLISIFIGGLLFMCAGKINGEFTDRKTYPWIGNAAFDVSGVIVRLHDLREQEILFHDLSSALMSHGDLSVLKTDYSPVYWVTLFRGHPAALEFPRDSANGDRGFFGLPEHNREVLKAIWLRTIIAHPTLWLQHRTAVFANVLGVDKEGRWDLAVFDPNYYPDDRSTRYGRNPVASDLQKVLQWRINSFKQWFFFLPVFYFVLLIILMIYALSQSLHRQSASIYVIASGILHEAGLWLAAPSPDYRYSHHMVFCCLLSILLILCERSRVEPLKCGRKMSS
jgi:hypothetical protein